MNQAAISYFKCLNQKYLYFKQKDNGIRRQKVCLNPSKFGVLFWKLWAFKLAHKIYAELSTGFVLIISVPSSDQSKSNTVFMDSYLYKRGS